MELKDYPLNVRPYIFHAEAVLDLELDAAAGEARGTCPFCDKDQHFSINQETGQFRCLRCSEEGNYYSFLAKIWETSFGSTSPEDYLSLSKERGLSTEFLKEWEFARHFVLDCWCIPGRNRDGAIANLYIYRNGALWSTPEPCTHQLLGLHRVNPKHAIVDITEGVWDAVAWDETLSTLKLKKTNATESIIQTTDISHSLRSKVSIVACPGVNVFKPQWSYHFKDKTARFLFDNDHVKKHPKTGKETRPGYDGAVRSAEILGPYAKELRILKWGQRGYDPKIKDGYDVRDCYLELGAAKCYHKIFSLLKPYEPKNTAADGPIEVEELEPLPRDSFAALCADYEAALHFTEPLRDTLAVTLATVLSTTLRGDQLWLRVIGPPGSGKSTIAEALSAAREYVKPVSQLTGFHSGYTGGQTRGPKTDASLIPAINNKTVITKDADTLLQNKALGEILGELRDLYDGSTRSHYRNRKQSEYEGLRTTFILCGTDDLRSLNRSSLGERFLDCEILGDADTEPFLQRASSNAYCKVISGLKSKTDKDPASLSHNRMLTIKRATMGYIIYLKEHLADFDPPDLSRENEKRIQAFAKFVAFMRFRPASSREETGTRSRVDLPTRLIEQFTRLAVCLGLVLGKKEIDKEVMRIVRKIAIDSAQGFPLEIARLIHNNPTGQTVEQIRLTLGVSATLVRKVTGEMQEIGIVKPKTRPNNSGMGGRSNTLWTLPQTIANICKATL